MAVCHDDIERLIDDNGLTACFDCGKCTASCPMSELFADLTFARTPRGIIEKALIQADLVTDDAIWFCLTCEVCTKGCPSGVKIRDFITALRQLVIEAGHDQYGVRCRDCNGYFLPQRPMKLLIEKLTDANGPPEFLLTCPRCRTRGFSQKVKQGRAAYPRDGYKPGKLTKRF